MAKRVFTQTFGVVGAILEHNGNFLLIKEAFKGFDKGKWSHPAGWIDVGENPIDATKREVLEESGFEFTPTQLLGVYSLVRRDFYRSQPDRGVPHAIKLIFKGKINNLDSPRALYSDSAATKWFTPEEIFAMEKDTLRDEDIKQMVRDYLNGNGSGLSGITHTIQE